MKMRRASFSFTVFFLFAGVLAIEASPFAYITDSCLYPGRVNVVDTATDTVVATVSVGYHPFGVVVNPAGTRVYVTNNGDSSVSVIDTTPNSSTLNTVVATIPVGPAPYGIAINPAGTRVYVANNGPGGSNTVSVIDTGLNAVVATITAIGFGATGLILNPAGTRLYVPNNPGNTLTVVDTSTNCIAPDRLDNAVGVNRIH